MGFHIMHITVIEDDTQSARMVVKLLQKTDHQVTISETGEAGLTSIFAEPPDLILIDLGLPDIDGQTVIALLRQQAALTGIPIIAFTAWPEHAAHSMAKAYGCDGVITKPINTRTFVEQIEAFLKPESA
jgi:DNA-binding response OmpR family regulator